MDVAQSVERTIVSTFVEKARRERLLALVEKPRARDKLRRELLDLSRMDVRLVALVPRGAQTSAGIRTLLAKAGAPAHCYIVSENPDWDASRMPLAEALDLVVGAGWVTLVCCRPEGLLYFEGEAPGLRAILSAPSSSRRSGTVA